MVAVDPHFWYSDEGRSPPHLMFIFSSREVAVVVVVFRYQHSVFVGPRSIPHPTTKIATKKKSITRNISVLSI